MKRLSLLAGIFLLMTGASQAAQKKKPIVLQINGSQIINDGKGKSHQSTAERDSGVSADSPEELMVQYRAETDPKKKIAILNRLDRVKGPAIDKGYYQFSPAARSHADVQKEWLDTNDPVLKKKLEDTMEKMELEHKNR